MKQKAMKILSPTVFTKSYIILNNQMKTCWKGQTITLNRLSKLKNVKIVSSHLALQCVVIMFEKSIKRITIYKTNPTLEVVQ